MEQGGTEDPWTLRCPCGIFFWLVTAAYAQAAVFTVNTKRCPFGREFRQRRLRCCSAKRCLRPARGYSKKAERPPGC